MLEEGVIESSNSEWASPMVIIKKMDDTIQLRVDYKNLNAETELDAYLMPRVDDILSQTKYITTLDLAKGYWQIPVVDKDWQKTAFITSKGLYRFRMMPFWLCRASATFQRMMDQVIRRMNWFRLMEVGLMTKPLKRQLTMVDCTYLGHMVEARGK